MDINELLHSSYTFVLFLLPFHRTFADVCSYHYRRTRPALVWLVVLSRLQTSAGRGRLSQVRGETHQQSFCERVIIEDFFASVYLINN